MKSKEYWENAALLREIAVQDGATATAEDILKLYDEALDDIDEEIRKIKANFQRRFGLDDETAAYFLEASQQEENLNNLVKALEAAPNEKARNDILRYTQLDGLSVRAYAARTERYEAVKQSIYARIKKLAADEITLMSGMLVNAYKESYYGLIDDTAKGLNFGINFAMLNDDAIEEAINVKWHGKRFSERIWKNTDRLADEAQKLVTKALMSGESLDKTAKKLSERFEVEKYHATTLVRTEVSHVHAMADLKAYEELGIEEYKYLATLDYITCETCQQHDGMVYKVSEAREGVNYPTMHPRCRCTTTMNMDYSKRSARNSVTGKSELVDGNVTYSEWVKNMTPEQRSALELSRKKNSNKTADKLQHEKYKKVLGRENVPETLDKWQIMRYTKPNEWGDLKRFYKYKTQNSTAEYKHYLIYNELKEKGIDFGAVLPPEKINAYILKDENAKRDPYHIMHRMKERNITDDEVRRYQTEANIMFSQWNGKRKVYYSADGVSVITENPEYWVYKTAWKKEDFDDISIKILEVVKAYE